MKKLILISLSFLLVSCSSVQMSLNPQEIKTADTRTLCEFYSYPKSKNYLDVEIKRELNYRGQTECTSKEYLELRLEQYKLEQQRVFKAIEIMNQPSKSVNCTSTRSGNTVNTSCY